MGKDPGKQSIIHIVKGAGINFIGTVTGNGLRILYIFFLARILSQAELGLFSLGLTILKILVVISLIGLDTGVIRFVALYRGENNTAQMRDTVMASLLICCPFSILAGVALFLLSHGIAAEILNKPELTSVLQYFSLAVPFLTVSSIFLAATQALKLMQYKVYSRELADTSLRFTLTIIFFLSGLKLYGAVFACTISIIAVTGLAYYFMRKVFPSHRGKMQRKLEFGKLIRFSFPNSISEITARLIMWTDILMLGYFADSKDVGIYTIVIGIAWIGIVFLESFSSIFNPIIADLYNRRQHVQLESLFKTVSKWIFASSFPFYLLIILFAKPLLGIYGSGYITGALSLIVLCLAQIIFAVTGLPGYVLIMSGRSWLNMVNNIVVCVVNIILNYILIPKYGIVGAAVATGLSLSSVNMLRLAEVYYILKIHPYNASYLKPLFAGIISIIGVHVLVSSAAVSNQYVGMSIGALTFVLLYIFLIYVQGIDQEDMFILEKMRSKFTRGFASFTR